MNTMVVFEHMASLVEVDGNKVVRLDAHAGAPAIEGLIARWEEAAKADVSEVAGLRFLMRGPRVRWAAA